MPRKRSRPSILEDALASRWPLSAGLCGIFATVGFVILPGVLSSNAVFRPLAATIRLLSLFPVIGFGAIAVIKFFRETSTAKVSEHDRRPRAAFNPSSNVRRSSLEGGSDHPAAPAPPEAASSPRPTAWSLALLQAIEWKRFEEVVAAYFRAKNFRCETIGCGPDGGVDGRLYFGDLPDAVGIVQCKAWGNKQVGVAPVRELLGVMAHEKVSREYFCATGDFSKDAIAFAAANPIKLISGRDLIDAIAQMSNEASRVLLAVSTTGDYTTPTCPSCGIKLVERTIAGKAAWGCRHYPRCRAKIFRRTDRATVTT